MIYEVPYMIRKDATSYKEKYAPHKYTLYNGLIPMVGAFGGHPV